MKRYLLSVILILPILGGCSSFLDKLPDDRTVIDSPEKVRELLVSAYPLTSYIMFAEQMSDNVEDKGVWPILGQWYPDQQRQAYNWEDITNENQDTPTAYWEYSWRAIASTNAALEAIAELGDTEEYQMYKGEALVARAFNHFMLVNIFAEHYDPATAASTLGVTYMDHTENESLVIYDRNSVEEVYSLVEKDLLEGLPLILDKAYVTPGYHFNRNAANAFAARYYLFRGDDWDKVIEYTTAVLGEGQGYVDRLRDYPGVYTKLTSNMEAYANRYVSVDEPANLMILNYASLWYRGAFVSRYGLDLTTKNAIFNTLPFSGKFAYGEFGSSPNITLFKGQEDFVYSTPGGSSGMAYIVGVEFPIEEVLFNRAEAYVMNGDYTSALADLNAFISKRVSGYSANLHRVTLENIKKTYGPNTDEYPELQPHYKDQLNEDQQAMLKCITDFRRKEFCQEGKRWFDIKRFHLPVVHTRFGSNQVNTLERNDLRRAVQLPAQTTGYGVPKNPR